MRKDSTYGDEVCLVAFSHIYNVKIRIFRNNLPPIIIKPQNSLHETENEINLFYAMDQEHYQSLIFT